MHFVYYTYVEMKLFGLKIIDCEPFKLFSFDILEKLKKQWDRIGDKNSYSWKFFN